MQLVEHRKDVQKKKPGMDDDRMYLYSHNYIFLPYDYKFNDTSIGNWPNNLREIKPGYSCTKVFH